jgi:hypothetical protein
MKLRINNKEICDVDSPRKAGVNGIEFLVTAEWNRVPPGKAEIVDDKGKARPVTLMARRVGYREVWIKATYQDSEMAGGAG